MADPVSVAGSIAGLVSLGDTVFRKLYHYTKAVKNAEKEIAELKNEVAIMNGIVHNLRLVVQDLEGDEFMNYAVRMDHVDSCLALLHKLNDRLDAVELSADKKLRNALAKIVWPFKSGDTKSFIAEIQRLRDNLNFALSADSMTAILKCLSTQDNIADRLNDVRELLRNREELETKITLDSQRRRILQFFLSVDPQPNFRISLKLRYPHTGFWLTEDDTFRTWMQEGGTHIWLSGIPGSGKTVLSSLVIQRCMDHMSSDRAVAFFYCDYKTEGSQEITNILSGIASQLARQNEASFSLLQKYYDSLQPKNQLGRKPEAEELTSVLQQMAATFYDVRIIIDGLDECGESAGMAANLLSGLVSDGVGNIFLAIFSRDEIDIRSHLNPLCQHIEIAAHSKDIDHYVRTEIESRTEKGRLRIKNPALKDLIINELVSKAQGMFRWVTCQLDHLCDLPTDAMRRRALNELPQTLNETYERILLRIPKSSIPIVQRTLYWTAYASPKLNIPELLEAVSIEEDADSVDLEARLDEEEILRCCSSLIRKIDNAFQLAHFTVLEYLESIPSDQHLLCAFQLSQNVEFILGRTCLRYLCFHNFSENPPSTIEEFYQRLTRHPFYTHAAYSWDEYMTSHLEKTDMLALAQRLFDPIKTNNFRLLIISYLMDRLYRSRRLEIPQEIRDTIFKISSGEEFRPLHAAALMNIPEICRWLIAGEVDVSQRSELGAPLECAVFHTQQLFCLESGWGKNFEDRRTSETIIALLDAGADPNAKTSQPQSLCYGLLSGIYSSSSFAPLDEAVKRGMQFDDMSLELLELEQNRDKLPLILVRVAHSTAWDISIDQRSRLLEIGRNFRALASVDDKFLSAEFSDEAFYQSISTSIEYDDLESFHRIRHHPRFVTDMSLPESDGSLLHPATFHGSSKVLTFLLEQGFDVFNRTKQGQTAFFSLSHRTKGSVVDILSKAGLSPEDQDASKKTPLHAVFARSDKLEFVQLPVLSRLATPTTVRSLDVDGKSPWFYFCDTFVPSILRSNFINKGQMLKDYIGLLIECGAIMDDNKNDGSDWFHFLVDKCLDHSETCKSDSSASRNESNDAIAQVVLNAMWNVEDLEYDPCMRRLLVWALLNGRMKILKALANIDSIRHYFASSLAIPSTGEEAEPELYDLLEIHAPTLAQLGCLALDALDTLGKAPVHYICSYTDSIKMLEILLKLEIDINILAQTSGKTAVHFAAEAGNSEAVRLLLNYNADVSILDSSRWTVIDSAIKGGSAACLRNLLDHILLLGGHWVWNSTNPFHFAAAHNPDAIDILAQHVTDHQELYLRSLSTQMKRPYCPTEGSLVLLLEQQSSDIKDGLFLGGSALHQAAYSKQPRAVEKLLGIGARANSKDSNGATPLHHAAWNGLAKVCQILIDHGASPDFRDNFFTTPLMAACYAGSVDTVKLLAPLALDRYATDIYGRCAVHHVVEGKCLEIFIYLMDHGWDISVRDCLGRHPLDLALEDDYFATYVFMKKLELHHLMPDTEHDSSIVGTQETRYYRRLLRALPEECLPTMINFESRNMLLPLCYAARTGNVENVKLLLKNGANIELYSRFEGTALIAACSAGELESVRCLIRHGAKLHATLRGEQINAFQAARNHKHIIEWLLVGKHTDQLKLTAYSKWDTEVSAVKLWAGIRELQIPLVGRFARKREQSLLEYVRYIYKRKEDWRRMVPLGWDSRPYLL